MNLVTPGRMTPVLSGGVTSSFEPSGSSNRMKRFIAPTWWQEWFWGPRCGKGSGSGSGSGSGWCDLRVMVMRMLRMMTSAISLGWWWWCWRWWWPLWSHGDDVEDDEDDDLCDLIVMVVMMLTMMMMTSVISWSAPKSQRHWWQPCCSAIFCNYRALFKMFLSVHSGGEFGQGFQRTSNLCPQRGCIVGSHLCVPAAPRPGSNILWVRQQVHRLEARRVVRANWAEEDKESCFASGSHSKGRLCPNHGRPDVEGGGGVVGHPLLVDHNQLPDALDQLVPIKGRQASPWGG